MLAQRRVLTHGYFLAAPPGMRVKLSFAFRSPEGALECASLLAPWLEIIDDFSPVIPKRSNLAAISRICFSLEPCAEQYRESTAVWTSR
jgi:hypothetical protein